jgi:hypothetical protein
LRPPLPHFWSRSLSCHLERGQAVCGCEDPRLRELPSHKVPREAMEGGLQLLLHCSSMSAQRGRRIWAKSGIALSSRPLGRPPWVPCAKAWVSREPRCARYARLDRGRRTASTSASNTPTMMSSQPTIRRMPPGRRSSAFATMPTMMRKMPSRINPMVSRHSDSDAYSIRVPLRSVAETGYRCSFVTVCSSRACT